MNTRYASALLLSLTLASTSVLAQGPGRNQDDRYRSPEHSQRRDQDRNHNRHERDRADNQRDHWRGDRRDDRAGYGGDRFRRGERLPRHYRDRAYVVDHWHAHHLKRPPRGHEWVQVGGDYVLVAIATGVIVSIILNH